MSNLNHYRIEKDRIRENFNKYTRKAFELIPKINNPKMLDIGCGTGVPTIELAKISNGNIIGLDIDINSLKLFKRKIEEKKLTNKIRVVDESILKMNFSNENFDIIWAEGSIFIIGFENALRQWYRFLKPKGFLVIHDEIKDKNNKLELIKKNNYSLIDEFEISNHLWWLNYYNPLEKLIQRYRQKYRKNFELIKEINKDQIEIDQYTSNSLDTSSFFVIMQKM